MYFKLICLQFIPFFNISTHPPTHKKEIVLHFLYLINVMTIYLVPQAKQMKVISNAFHSLISHIKYIKTSSLLYLLHDSECVFLFSLNQDSSTMF